MQTIYHSGKIFLALVKLNMEVQHKNEGKGGIFLLRVMVLYRAK
jgi:hypothetical protein